MALFDTYLSKGAAPITVQVHAPLMSVETARACLPGTTEDNVLRMIEARELEWVWDIACKESRRREVRILSACVAQRQSDHTTRLTFKEALRLIFGAPRPFITGKEFFSAFNCCPGHVIKLMREGTLQRAPHTEWRCGPNGSPSITWESLAAFLKERREPDYRWGKAARTADGPTA